MKYLLTLILALFGATPAHALIPTDAREQQRNLSDLHWKFWLRFGDQHMTPFPFQERQRLKDEFNLCLNAQKDPAFCVERYKNGIDRSIIELQTTCTQIGWLTLGCHNYRGVNAAKIWKEYEEFMKTELEKEAGRQ